MLLSLYSAVSGLQANQTMLDTVGNNIANVNTTGFKGTGVQFQDLLSQTIAGATTPTAGLGGTNGYQMGLGVRVAGTTTDFTEGTELTTGRALDVSIQGNGFLIGVKNGQDYYTRAGSLNLDANGNLVTPDGMFVQGWMANSSGVVSTAGAIGNIVVPTGASVPAVATTQITLQGNIALNSGSAPTASYTVYDSLGNPSTMTLTFTQPAGGGWQVTGTDGTTTVGPATVPLNAVTGATSAPTMTLGGYTLNIGNLTANGGGSTVSVASQNGAPAGTLQSFSISDTGVIEGAFSNNVTQPIGQIGLATFANPNALSHAGNTSFTASANSGLAQVGTAATGSRGVFSPGTLESSNVDLGQQFTDMIQAQRGFEANTKMVTTDNTILGDLVGMVQ